MKNKQKLNKKGQMVIELILVMTVMLAIVGALKTTLNKSEAFKALVQGPWKVLSGMISSGSWQSPDKAIQNHPALHRNHSSLRGKNPNE